MMAVLRYLTSRNAVLLLCYVIVNMQNTVIATIKPETEATQSNDTESQLFFEKISKYCYETYHTSCFWLDCLLFAEKYNNFTSIQLFKGVYIDRVNSSTSDSSLPTEFHDQQRQMEESPSQLLDTYIQYKLSQILGSLVVKIHLLPDKSALTATFNSTTANRSNSILDAGRRRRVHLSSTLYAVILGAAAAMLTKSLTLSLIAIILSVLRVPRFPFVPGLNSENSSYRLSASPPYPVLFNHNHHHASGDSQYVDDIGGGTPMDDVRDTYHINYWPRKKQNHDDGSERRVTVKV